MRRLIRFTAISSVIASIGCGSAGSRQVEEARVFTFDEHEPEDGPRTMELCEDPFGQPQQIDVEHYECLVSQGRTSTYRTFRCALTEAHPLLRVKAEGEFREARTFALAKLVDNGIYVVVNAHPSLSVTPGLRKEKTVPYGEDTGEISVMQPETHYVAEMNCRFIPKAEP